MNPEATHQVLLSKKTENKKPLISEEPKSAQLDNYDLFWATIFKLASKPFEPNLNLSIDK